MRVQGMHKCWTIKHMEPRPLTDRERALLDALLSVEFPNAEELRKQSSEVSVVAACGCGCPSIDFVIGRGLGMSIRVNAALRGSPFDGLFLWTIEDVDRREVLGGIEWLGNSKQPDPEELPDPSLLAIDCP